MEKSITNRWSLNTTTITGTDICEEGIPHTNRSIVNILNRYERELKQLQQENKQLQKDNERLCELLETAIWEDIKELKKRVWKCII